MSFSIRPFTLSALILLLASACGTPNPGRVQADRFASKTGTEFSKDSISGYRLYFSPGSYAEEQLDPIRTQALEARNRAFELIQKQDAYKVYDLYLLGTRPLIRSLVPDAARTGGTNANRDLIVTLVSKDSPNLIGYGVFHLISEKRLGRPSLPWLIEGMSVYANGDWYGYEPHALANYLHQQGMTVTLDELITQFFQVDEKVAYPQAGSFLKYLYEKYGAEKVFQIWRTGSRSFTNVLGVLPEVAEREWLAHIASYPTEDITYLEGWKTRF